MDYDDVYGMRVVIAFDTHLFGEFKRDKITYYIEDFIFEVKVPEL